jgi:hypothetical protein
MKRLIMKFSVILRYFPSLRLKYLPYHHMLEQTQIMYSKLQVHIKEGKVIFLCILMFMGLVTGR